ncbi:uncharacterized protein LOC124369059 [Homalodisca vitripennis]|uniref:uncharacterized protein LOC124369059 n=1 Tax=Homalodisca vitripennis TaxID=197043 RepID=UPI001EEB87D0|nr:uncharacterized protein LOC124369059 [Homalodisca vitripennis]
MSLGVVGQPTQSQLVFLGAFHRAQFLGPVLFLLFINDLPRIVSGVNARICLFADDTSLTVRAPNQLSLRTLTSEKVCEIVHWFEQNELKLNGSKTNLMEFSISGSVSSEPLAISVGIVTRSLRVP